jgi:hypothetical protein
MSLQHFLRAWALQDVYNDCQQDYRADIGVLTIGKTFVGFRYRDAANNIIVVLSPHLPRNARNIIGTLEGIHVSKCSVSAIDMLCKTYRKWSFSLHRRGANAWSMGRNELVNYIEKLREYKLPAILGWPSPDARGWMWWTSNNYKSDPADVAFKRRVFTEVTLRQLIRIGLIEDGYAVAYAQMSNDRDGVIVGESLPTREQMIAFQLGDRDDFDVMVLR